MNKGLFIVLEGMDGAGTSTMTNKIHDYIKEGSKYVDVLTTHEPWRSEKIKKRLAEDKDSFSGAQEMLELYFDDRADHNQQIIKPMLNQEVVVISDRYDPSTFVYQGVQGVDFDKIRKARESRNLVAPDITIFLDVDYEVARERIARRGGKLEKFERDEKFVRAAIDKYREWFEMAKENNSLFGFTTRVDGNKSVEEVKSNIITEIDPVYWTYLKKRNLL